MDWISVLAGLVDTGLLITIPILYGVGYFIKAKVPFLRRYIPMIIFILGLGTALFYYIPQIVIESGYDVMKLIFSVLTQGTTCAGGAILINEVISQYKKINAERKIKDIDAIREALLKDIDLTNIASGIGSRASPPASITQSAQTVDMKNNANYWQ